MRKGQAVSRRREFVRKAGNFVTEETSNWRWNKIVPQDPNFGH